MLAVVTSLCGLLCLAAAAFQEVRTARGRGVSVSALDRPPTMRYLLIAFPFLFVVSALGEEHLLLGVGLAVLAQSAYVTWWRAQPRA